MKKYSRIIVIIIILVVSYFLYNHFFEDKDKYSWKLTTTSKGSIAESITTIGTINPIVTVNVGTEVSGKIESVYKDFNDTVKKGDLLAKLDTENLEFSLEEAKIKYQKNQIIADYKAKDYSKSESLFAKKVITEDELDKSKYDYDIAKQNLKESAYAVKRAKKNLNNAYIYSPINGVVISRVADEGQTVASSLNAPTLFKLANSLSDMQIDAEIDEIDIGKVKHGQKVKFTVDAIEGKVFTGKVKEIRLNPSSSSDVVTYTVIISHTNPDNILLPGLTANIEIIIKEVNDIVTLKENALMYKPTEESMKLMGFVLNDLLPTATNVNSSKKSHKSSQTSNKRKVWVLDNNKPVLKEITVGISNGRIIEIKSGLSLGEQVIYGLTKIVSKDNQAASAFSGNNTKRVKGPSF